MNKDQILIAAAQIFGNKGFHAASMQDIAEAVNLQKASLYHHVNSKQEILLELLDQALDVLTEQVGNAIDGNGSAEVRLKNAVFAYLTTMLEHRDLASVLLLEHRSLEPELQAKHIPRRDRFEKLWRDLILEGKTQGIFECAEPALAARAILGTLNWTITWFNPQGALSAAEISENYVELFLHGLHGGTIP
ncbi:MAG: TetR/AcrR family transcriptional regulator [Anaerolineales bacterium]|jgi:AcrR family transcriptional regulator